MGELVLDQYWKWLRGEPLAAQLMRERAELLG